MDPTSLIPLVSSAGPFVLAARREKKMAGVGDRGSSSPSPVLSPERPEEPSDRDALVNEVRRGEAGAIKGGDKGDNGGVKGQLFLLLCYC